MVFRVATSSSPSSPCLPEIFILVHPSIAVSKFIIPRQHYESFVKSVSVGLSSYSVSQRFSFAPFCIGCSVFPSSFSGYRAFRFISPRLVLHRPLSSSLVLLDCTLSSSSPLSHQSVSLRVLLFVGCLFVFNHVLRPSYLQVSIKLSASVFPCFLSPTVCLHCAPSLAHSPSSSSSFSRVQSPIDPVAHRLHSRRPHSSFCLSDIPLRPSFLLRISILPALFSLFPCFLSPSQFFLNAKSGPVSRRQPCS